MPQTVMPTTTIATRRVQKSLPRHRTIEQSSGAEEARPQQVQF
jgi:hypothetical protein